MMTHDGQQWPQNDTSKSRRRLSANGWMRANWPSVWSALAAYAGFL